MTQLPTVDISAEKAHYRSYKRGVAKLERSTGGATRAMCSPELQTNASELQKPTTGATSRVSPSCKSPSAELLEPAGDATKGVRWSCKRMPRQLQKPTARAPSRASPRYRWCCRWQVTLLLSRVDRAANSKCQ
jgi:hypothetical protein